MWSCQRYLSCLSNLFSRGGWTEHCLLSFHGMQGKMGMAVMQKRHESSQEYICMGKKRTKTFIVACNGFKNTWQRQLNCQVGRTQNIEGSLTKVS